MVPPAENRAGADGTGEKPDGALRWQGLFQRSAEAVFVLNRRRRLLFVNRAWEALTGVAAREARGWVCRRRPRDGDARWPELVQAALAPPTDVLAGNLAQVRRLLPAMPGHAIPRSRGESGSRGGPQWWHIQFVPFTDAEGVVGILGKIAVVRSEGLYAHPPLPEKIVALRERLAAQYRPELLSSEMPAMKKVAEQARLAAATRLPVLILGEPGTGKHWLARLIHRLGSGGDQPFFRLECGRLPAMVLHGLLDPTGPFQLPVSGTIYLQDVAGLPRELQDRLRQRLGTGEEGGPRLLAGLSGDPRDEIQAGRLLPALHCGLSVLTIALPPLRERPADLPRLIEDMLPRAGAAAEHPVAGVSSEALDVLRSYRWPGNLRELYEVLAGACGRAKGERIEASDLPFHVTSSPTTPAEPALPLDSLLEKVERRLITLALRLAKNNKTRAAELLSVWRPRLLRRMEALGIARE